MRPSGEVVFDHTCSLRRFANQFVGELRRIHDNIGPQEYKRRWKNNDFPLDVYEELIELAAKR